MIGNTLVLVRALQIRIVAVSVLYWSRNADKHITVVRSYCRAHSSTVYVVEIPTMRSILGKRHMRDKNGPTEGFGVER